MPTCGIQDMSRHILVTAHVNSQTQAEFELVWCLVLKAFAGRSGLDFPTKKCRNCAFLATKQRMFEVFAIDKTLRYRGTRFPGSRTLCHPGWKQKNKIRTIGHWGQKHSASCLLHFLLATLLLATWPKPQLFQLKDLMQRYSTQQIWPTQFILTQQHMSCKSHPSR